MELRRAGYAIVFAFMLCALVTVGLNWKKRAEMPFGNGPLEMNEETAELAWNFCRKEMPDGRDSFQDLYFCMPQEAIRMLKSTLWTRRNMQKVICDLSPELKQELFDCLTMKNPVFGISSQVASFSDHLRKTLRLVFDWSSSSPKRHQAYRSNLQIVYSISPSMAPSAIAVSPSYGPTPVSPSYGPTPSSYVTSDRLYSTHYHRQTNIQNYQADEAEITSGSSTIKRSEKEKEKEKDKDKDKDKKKKKKKKKKNKNQTVIAIVTTAVATFSFVSMMFLCLCCCRGSNNRMSPSDRRKDDAPLLHISLSASSSQNSASLENLSKTEYCGRAGAYRSNLPMNNANPNYPLAQVPLTGGGNPVVEASPHLKPPPGRVIPPPPPPAAAAPPPPPPPTARPPPPPKPPPPQGPRPPPAPPPKAKAPPPGPLGRGRNKSSEANDIDSETGAPKTKLKPFFWDKVVASPDHTMVWHEISDGSFQFNEEMIESLFGYTMVESNKNERKKEPTETSKRYIQIIDPRKAQNLSILLRALNVTIDEIVDALLEGNQIPVELLETLLKMAPTAEEELKLRLFSGDVSQLGPAERFLKVLIDIPSAFRRIEALIFMSNMQEEVVNLKQSFATFEVACNKIRNSRLFLKLLEAVLKTGNRMNDGTYRGGALAFKLDTLLKLSDVKGTDGKTTLLHFVVQEIIRSEGVRAVRTARSSSNVSSVKTEDFIQDSDQLSTEHYSNLGLQVVSGLFNELEDVRKAAVIDADGLASSLTKLKQSLLKNKAFLSNDLPPTEEENDQFRCALVSFLDRAESDISWLSEEEKRITALVKSTADYFHGNAGRDEGLRLFSIVRDFLVMLDKTCREVKDARARKPARTLKANPPAASASSETSDKHSDMQSERLFPAIRGRRAGSSSSDDESPSP